MADWIGSNYVPAASGPHSPEVAMFQNLRDALLIISAHAALAAAIWLAIAD
jgi:hypothetical protein